MMNDEEKRDFRALLVEVLQTEVRAIVTDVVGAAFSESQRLTGDQLRELQHAIAEVHGSIEANVDRLDVIETDVRAVRHATARLKRRDQTTEADITSLSRRVDDLEAQA